MIFDEIEDSAIVGIKSTVRKMIKKIVVTSNAGEPRSDPWPLCWRDAGGRSLESFEP